MRLSRLVATALAVVGLGLVSGAVTQVAALDGNLKRAAAEPSPSTPLVRLDESARPDGTPCPHNRRPTAAPTPEST
jgi:hypothetical protein